MNLIIGHRHRGPSSIYRSVLPPSKPPTNQSTKINHLNDVLRSIFAKHDQTTIFDHISLLHLHRSHSSTCFWAHELYTAVVATFSQSLSLLFRCTWGSAQIIHSFIPNGRWWTSSSGLSSVQPRPLLETTVPISYSCAKFTLFTFCAVVYFGYERRTRVDRWWWWWWLEGAFTLLLSLAHLKQGSLIHNIRYISLRKGNNNITIYRVQRYYSNGNTNKFSAGIHTRFLAHILVDGLLEVAVVAW